MLSSAIVQEFDQGYRAAFGRLARIFRSRGITSEDAEDLAQEAVLRTLSHLDRHGRRPGDLTPLMNTIAKNLVVERFRNGGRELPFEPDDRLVSPATDPADDVTRTERRDRVNRAIDELPARQRLAIRLWLDGSGPADIAAELGLKRNAADALLHRARRFLATRLEDCRDSMWGAGSLGIAKLRLAMRRSAAWLGPVDTSVIAPAIAAGLATIALGSLSPAHQVVEDVRGPRSVATFEKKVIEVHPLLQPPTGYGEKIGTVVAPGAPGSEDTWKPVNVAVRDPEVTVSTPPLKRSDGQRLPIWVSVYSDEEEVGPVESAALAAIDKVCDRVPQACEEE